MPLTFKESKMILSMYRPFTKKWLCYDRDLIHRPSRYDSLIKKNKEVMYVSTNSIFSSLMTEYVPEYAMLTSGKGFLENINSENSLDNVKYDFNLDKEDLIYYVYGVLHSKEYIEKYSNDLYKSLPRIPKLKHLMDYVNIGHKLSELHLNYETQDKIAEIQIEYSNDNPSYRVEKMKHPKKGVLDTIIYNNDIKVTNIPERAYDYVVNGKPAIEWIIDQYQVKTDKKSGITDDPNEFSDDPKYILNLLLSVITVSMKTLDLIDELPPFELDE